MPYGITRRDELRIDVAAMCAEITRIESEWCTTREELGLADGCVELSGRLRALRRELSALRASLDP